MISKGQIKKIDRALRVIITVAVVVLIARGYIHPKNMQNQYASRKIEQDEGVRQQATVVEIVDGDTIKIDYHGKIEKLRMIGIDTPESVHPNKKKNTRQGKTASNFTKQELLNKKIEVEFDVQKRDKYGRLLGYVYVDGKMYNKTLLEEGYARLATYPPNVRYVDDFKEIQKQAQQNKKGFWNDTLWKKEKK